MAVDFEQQIYGEILEAYIRNNPDTLFEYRELIKLMSFKCEWNGITGKQLNSIITNSIILLISLFFQKNASSSIYEQNLTSEDRKKIVNTFQTLL